MEKLSETKKEEIVDELLNFLTKELGKNPPKNLSIKDKREIVDSLMMLQPPQNMGDYFYGLQDKLLSDENVVVHNVNAIKFKHGEYEIVGDGMDTNADIFVYASKVFIPSDLEKNLDNIVILKAGLQLKYKLYNMLLENGFLINDKEPYITDAYNLKNNFIAKMVFDLKSEDCFISGLDFLFKFIKQNNLKSVTFNLKNVEITNAKKIIQKIKKQNKLNCNIIYAV